MTVRLLVAAAVVALLRPAAAAGQVTAPAAGVGILALRGRVLAKETGTPIRDAEVLLPRDSARVRTDSLGAFRLPGLSAGPHPVVIRAIGYTEVAFTAQLGDGGDAAFDVQMDAIPGAAQQLAPVEVTEAPARVSYRLVDFERRRHSGRGQYLDLAQIEQSGASNIQDLTRGMRGVTTHCGGGGGCRIQMVRAPNGCEPEYVVDGRRDNMFGAQTPIRDIAAMEVYTGPSDVPGEFAGRNAGCGVVVIWTRVGPEARPKRAKKGSEETSRAPGR